VIVLDENILVGQRLFLEGLRIPTRQVGLDVGRKGLKDEEIVVLLDACGNQHSSLEIEVFIRLIFAIRATQSW
jgi:hypothetical protein